MDIATSALPLKLGWKSRTRRRRPTWRWTRSSTPTFHSAAKLKPGRKCTRPLLLRLLLRLRLLLLRLLLRLRLTTLLRLRLCLRLLRLLHLLHLLRLLLRLLLLLLLECEVDEVGEVGEVDEVLA